MKILLDTHIAIWAVLDSEELSDVVRVLFQCSASPGSPIRSTAASSKEILAFLNLPPYSVLWKHTFPQKFSPLFSLH